MTPTTAIVGRVRAIAAHNKFAVFPTIQLLRKLIRKLQVMPTGTVTPCQTPALLIVHCSQKSSALTAD